MFFTREARPVAGEKNIFLWRRKGESQAQVHRLTCRRKCDFFHCNCCWLLLWSVVTVIVVIGQMTLKWPLMTLKWPWMTLKPSKYCRVCFYHRTGVLILFCIFISSDFMSKLVFYGFLCIMNVLKSGFLSENVILRHFFGPNSLNFGPKCINVYIRRFVSSRRIDWCHFYSNAPHVAPSICKKLTFNFF